MGAELRKNKIPFEHHISPKGGYGYGLRKGNPAAEAWFSFNTKLVKIYIKP
ncbi:MAG: hypothetical protein H7098_02835 [Oligoflexus sp.]|nr:hypothetical protein [Pseudopedobacter sp.]